MYRACLTPWPSSFRLISTLTTVHPHAHPSPLPQSPSLPFIYLLNWLQVRCWAHVTPSSARVYRWGFLQFNLGKPSTIAESLLRQSKSRTQDSCPWAITVANVYRFSKFFHLWTQQWLCKELLLKIPPRLKHVATLPCKTLSVQKLN